MKQAGAEHLQWPTEHFYWGLLDASAIPKSNGPTRLHQQLGYLFENVVPGASIEEVHAIYERLPNGSRRYLACGVPKDVLRQQVPATALTLSPQALPDFVSKAIGNEREVGPLNLLRGSFAPRPVRILRRRCWLQVAASLVVCALILIAGLERRVATINQACETVSKQRDDLCQEVLGSTSKSGSQPLGLRLLAELRQLEQTRSSAAAPDTSMENCSLALADLMAHWPSQLHAQTESISITPASITLRTQVPDMADAQALANAFIPLRGRGWQVAQPQSEARKDQVDVSLRLERASGSKAGHP